MIIRTFYAKLALVFLVLILSLGVGSLFIAFNASGHLFDEVEQLFNREYAGNIALELQPLVEEGFSEDSIKPAIHYMMVLNPMVEIYLLNEQGYILAYFTHPAEELKREKIDLSPIHKFVGSDGWESVLGDDPRTASKKKPFSAAELEMGNESGFVYVILRGEGYDKSLELLSSSYYLKTGLITFIIAIIVTLFVGFSVFFYETRRLRELCGFVKSFEKGDFNARIKYSGNDEFTDLSRAFNEMAQSIESGVEKLHLAEKQRSDLIANISHDLRSPITSIRGHLETILLKGTKLSENEGQELLRTSIKSVSSLQKLVEELFDLAKMESGQIKMEQETFIPAELVQDIVLKLKPVADKANIAVNIDFGDNLPVLTGDIALLERLLTNIIENGIFHTPEGGQITVSIKKESEMFSLVVSDTGDGVAEEDLPHVFERFYRADKSRNRTKPGTGLGLAIAKEIVELHNGSIAVENAAPPNIGAIFIIKLPIS